MNRKTMKKLFVIVLTVLMVILTATKISYALDPDTIQTVEPDVQEVKDLAGRILGALQVAGSILALIMIAVLGLGYLMGSPEGKADYKKSMIPYLVGAGIVFLAPQIAGIVYTFFTQEK